MVAMFMYAKPPPWNLNVGRLENRILVYNSDVARVLQVIVQNKQVGHFLSKKKKLQTPPALTDWLFWAPNI